MYNPPPRLANLAPAMPCPEPASSPGKVAATPPHESGTTLIFQLSLTPPSFSSQFVISRVTRIPIRTTRNRVSMGTASDFAIKAVPAVLGLGLIWYIVNIVRSYLRLRHFTGPTIAGFSNLWVFSSTLRGELNERTAEILKGNGESVAFIILRVEPSSLIELL